MRPITKLTPMVRFETAPALMEYASDTHLRKQHGAV